jgi:hypothetical protein
MRYLGTIDMTGGPGLINGSLSFSPASYDAAIYVFPTGIPDDRDLQTLVTLENVTLGAILATSSFYRQGEYMDDTFVGFVSAAMGASWRVNASITDANGSSWRLYVFAAPSYPLSRVVRNQLPLLVRQLGVPRRMEYADQVGSATAAGVRNVVTFAADANGILGWILDHAAWRLMGRGTAEIGLARVLDGGAVAYTQRMSVTATTGVLDEHVLGPMAGYRSAPGNALVVDFAAAPAAANFQVISCGAYQYALL